MKSNYKILGQYIKKVDNKNKDAKLNHLVGLSMEKVFRKSTSNIVGTDLSKYKIVKQWQFACDFMSVIRVKKLPVVLHIEDTDIIVSPAYIVFEVIDPKILDPEYLMMWFRRDEFDRYAYFRCDSAVRGGFNWEELCEVELPIPSIEKQHEIVKEYNTIVNRISLNEELNQKLEETGQALYKHWFVDFEFPNEDGKPYKSSGGEMVYDENINYDIPAKWATKSLQDIIYYKKGFAFKSSEYTDKGANVIRVSNFTQNSIDIISCNKISIEKSKEYADYKLNTNDVVISTVGSWAHNPKSVVGNVIKVPVLADGSLLNQNTVRLKTQESYLQAILYFMIKNKYYSDYVISGAQGSANQASVTLDHLFSFKINLPKQINSSILFDVFQKIIDYYNYREKESFHLQQLSLLLLRSLSNPKSI